ncbi:MAG: NTP transferase domain-containing protein [Akkermansiaceae bacterium]|nr:NTP transferase domain-containing protein [Akkermansiaceae bacterium]
MNVVGILLARTDSARLPGKVLMEIGDGRRLIDLVHLRAARATRLDRLVLATTDRDCDDALARHAEESLGIEVFRGDPENVAGRALGCAESCEADAFVRINGDSPFVDPELLDEGIRLLGDSGADLVSNLLDRTYPYGVAVEVFRTETYRRVIGDFDACEREHISRHFYQNPDRFRLVSLPPSVDPGFAEIRLTVDDPEDLRTVGEIVRHLGAGAISAGYEAVATLARALQG